MEYHDKIWEKGVANHDANKITRLARFILHLFQTELCFPFKHLSQDTPTSVSRPECRLNEGIMRRVLEHSEAMCEKHSC